MLPTMLIALHNAYPLTELPAGEYAKLKVSALTFTVRHFTAEGLGHVCWMEGRGMLGLMRMETLVVNPFTVDAPLFSYDRIHAMGNDTLLLELYETRLARTATDLLRNVAAGYAALPDADPGTHWYDDLRWPESIKKKGKKAATPQLDALAADFTAAYIALCQTSPACRPEEKLPMAQAYTRGLIANGGPSTDAFVKAFGRERTDAFFREVFFGA